APAPGVRTRVRPDHRVAQRGGHDRAGARAQVPAGGAGLVSDRLAVLVVDDEAPSRDELAFLLEQQALVGRVAQAAGATACLELLGRDGFDAVFLDVRMPHLDGLALARLIGQMARPPQVVFVTAYEDHAVEAFGLAAVDYLMKPVRPERL